MLAVGGTPVVFNDPLDKKKKYDCTTAMGTAAVDLLSKWQSLKTADNVAPWRQNVSGGQFGDHKWVLALKAAFDVPGDEPHFKLWQVALADHAVRRLTHASPFVLTTSALHGRRTACCSRATPTPSTGTATTPRRTSLPVAATPWETPRRALTSGWRSPGLLVEALNNKNPAPLKYSVDGEERTLSLTIEDFCDADEPPASQLTASQHPLSQPR